MKRNEALSIIFEACVNHSTVLRMKIGYLSGVDSSSINVTVRDIQMFLSDHDWQISS